MGGVVEVGEEMTLRHTILRRMILRDTSQAVVPRMLGGHLDSGAVRRLVLQRGTWQETGEVEQILLLLLGRLGGSVVEEEAVVEAVGTRDQVGHRIHAPAAAEVALQQLMRVLGSGEHHEDNIQLMALISHG